MSTLGVGATLTYNFPFSISCCSCCQNTKKVVMIQNLVNVDYPQNVDWWCSGTDLASHAGGCRFKAQYPPILEECAKGICLCNLLRSTQPNDRETVIEG